MVTYEPVGPVAAFTAWNFPIVLQARKIAPALAAGCTILCRPAEEGTGAVAELIKCFIDAGVPAGVVNLVTGAPQVISETCMDSELIRKVTFTGSIPVGQHLMRRAADTVKRMSMELGGHAPVIIHEDVDPAKAAQIAATGKFRNNGQVCVSPTRFYVHASHKDAFTEHFVAATQKMKVGNGFDPDVEVGPLINRKRLEFTEKMVEDTIADGGKLVSGGKRPAEMNRGYFFEPTVFTDVPDDARIMIEEPFGPIAPMSTFETFDEVIERANSLPQGLASYVFTNSLQAGPQDRRGLEDRHRRREQCGGRDGRDAVRRGQALGLRPRERPPGHARLSGREVHEHRDVSWRVPSVARAAGGARPLPGASGGEGSPIGDRSGSEKRC